MDYTSPSCRNVSQTSATPKIKEEGLVHRHVDDKFGSVCPPGAQAAHEHHAEEHNQDDGTQTPAELQLNLRKTYHLMVSQRQFLAWFITFYVLGFIRMIQPVPVNPIYYQASTLFWCLCFFNCIPPISLFKLEGRPPTTINCKTFSKECVKSITFLHVHLWYSQLTWSLLWETVLLANCSTVLQVVFSLLVVPSLISLITQAMYIQVAKYETALQQLMMEHKLGKQEYLHDMSGYCISWLFIWSLVHVVLGLMMIILYYKYGNPDVVSFLQGNVQHFRTL
ncbi:hypothetical protein AN958_02178 [Leucoagaricus sp. SymC.cos]|nr:hypothetical protein AN958_02178 [Leucoagaricus sp. SymC.cos]